MSVPERSLPSLPEKECRLGVRILPQPESIIPIESPCIKILPSDYPIIDLKLDIMRQISEKLGIPVNQVVIIDSKQGKNGDLSIPAHQYAKKNVVKPDEGAVSFYHALDDSASFIEKAEPNSAGYLNIFIDMKNFGSAVLHQIETLGEIYGNQNLGKDNIAWIDESSPNVLKRFGTHHLGSTIIGDSIVRLLFSTGHTVIGDNHIGDYGTQFGQIGYGVKIWGNEYPGLGSEDPDVVLDNLNQIYVRINKEIHSEQKANDGYSELREASKAWFAGLEKGDPEAVAFHQMSVEVSFAEFSRIYEALGIQFHYILGESYYSPMLPQLVESLKKAKLVYEMNGAWVAAFKKRPIGEPLELIRRKLTKQEIIDINNQRSDIEVLVLQKTDEASTYGTRDMATMICRAAWNNPEQIVYVVGDQQEEYFRQVITLFNAWFDKAKIPQPKIVHAPFGLMTGPKGEKLSTREGNIVLLGDLIEQAIEKSRSLVAQKIKLNPGEEKASDEIIDQISRQIGIGLVKFIVLSASRTRNIKFDIDSALTFEGRKPPAIQYAHARTRSLLRKAEEKGIDIDRKRSFVLSEVDTQYLPEKNLIMHLARYPEAIQRALREYEPSVIAEYLLDLTTIFNDFYTKCPILAEGVNTSSRNSRLRLVEAAGQVIRNGLDILGIEAPERM